MAKKIRVLHPITRLIIGGAQENTLLTAQLLDKNEWESLKVADLHDEINQFFTKSWQQDIQEKETASKFDTMFLEKFGESDYQKIKEVREWLQENPNRNNLIAFLLDKDPFST